MNRGGHMEKVVVGIIGADSYHTVALVEQFLEMENVRIAFVDTIIRGNLAMSATRQERFEKILSGKVPLKKIDLKSHEGVDMYLVLNVDSSCHLEVLNSLKHYDKPIYIDKPIFQDLESFKQVESQVMSSSGLRFADFMKDVVIEDSIVIEAPLSYMEGIDGYFWYGIHMVEMLETISKSNIEIQSVTKTDYGELVSGVSAGIEFELRGHYDNINFSVICANGRHELSSYEHLYHSLALAILNINQWLPLDRTKNVIEAVIEINKKKSKL